LNFSDEEWKVYRASIVDYRNQMVAHHDLGATIANYPQYDKALVAANFMFGKLRGLVDPDWLGGIPTSLDRWSSGVADNMSKIVHPAFCASAHLGSNITRR